MTTIKENSFWTNAKSRQKSLFREDVKSAYFLSVSSESAINEISYKDWVIGCVVPLSGFKHLTVRLKILSLKSITKFYKIYFACSLALFIKCFQKQIFFK